MSTAAVSLKDLHQLHTRLREAQERLDRGPKQVEARNRFSEDCAVEVDARKKRLAQHKMAADEKTLQLKSNEARISELKLKLNSATSNREFGIIKSQIDADVMANSVLEDEILEVLEKVDQTQSAIREATEEHDKSTTEAERITAEVTAATPTRRAECEKLELALKAAETAIPASVMVNYRRLVQAHGSGALASVHGKACGACFAILSPNFLVEIRTGKIIFCRSCGRMLYDVEED